MNKAELVSQVSNKTGEAKAKVERILNEITSSIISSVAKGNVVTLIGFGSFKAQNRKAREGRNPRTGETIRIAASTVPKFVPAAAFKKAANNN